MAIVHFRIGLVIEPFPIKESEILKIEKRTPEPVSIILRQRSSTEQLSVYTERHVMCEATLERKATRSIAEWISHPFESVPSGFSDFRDIAFADLHREATCCISLLVWRRGFRHDRSPTQFDHSSAWSLDGENWQYVHDRPKLSISVGLPYEQLSDEIVQQVGDLWQSRNTEPLAQELFREAWRQRIGNPRSALVIGIAAAETAVKDVIASLVPEAEWLIKEIQSPNIHRLLSEYVPGLQVRVRWSGKVPPKLPKWLLDSLKKGVKLRNDVVHGKTTTIEEDTLREILETVNDIVYHCDLLNGHVWAYRRLSIRLAREIHDELST
jgi:hypothetical protein